MAQKKNLSHMHTCRKDTNDLLTGANKKKKYNDVHCIGYPFRRGKGIHLNLKLKTLGYCQRLRNTGKDSWSLAVLVPTKKLMLDVSEFLGSKQKLTNGKVFPAINHEVALETAGPSLAAILIAGLLENDETEREVANRLIHDLCEHIRGRKGNEPPSRMHLALSDALIKYVDSGKIQGKKRKFAINECLRIANECRRIDFSGGPADDWRAILKILFNTDCEIIKQVAIDAQYLRLLHKGALLSSSLGDQWRNNGNYSGATDIVRNALLQEHFAASTKVWTGIQVMTIHKAKGKEFDEVIIYEGYHQGKIVRDNASKKEIEQSRLKLRVAVTRAMKRVTILTPSYKMCRFLY
jgi:DNA helicase-2/ATP-dependent DNA helicase PcrA